MTPPSRSKYRTVSGVVLLDKPTGLTSNQALQRVKHLFNAEKAGHTGSLDPLASGLLPICLGEATKISGFLLDADKAYVTEARLGVTTDTGDADGQVIRQRDVPQLNIEQIEVVLNRFRGDIQQVPPMHSALKQNGQPLYKLAHRGESVERTARPVTIYSLELESFVSPVLRLRVRCSKGTYIRSLVEDIGEALGCGAHVTMLRRTAVAGATLATAHTLDQLQAIAAEGVAALDAQLIDMQDMLSAWPRVDLDAVGVYRLTSGLGVWLDQPPAPGLIWLHGPDHRLLGIGLVEDTGRIVPKRMLKHE
ncbi:MAG: tRNA pseudouridine(55) synthase TruB [Gammaproteobacteria bacterium]|nr:tRNA pseudouridine(55) synthase TruB [Gammaproteobacteria bacterium]